MAKKEKVEGAPRARKTLDERVAIIRASIAHHQRGMDRARAKLASLADEKKKRAALLLDEASAVERMGTDVSTEF